MRSVKTFFAAALATVGMGAAGATALAHVAAPRATSAGTTPTIKLTKTAIGKILTVRGFTLYMFTRDTKNHDSCFSIRGCTGTWRPLLSTGKPVAGTGVNATLLHRIQLPNGTHQVTYAGRPLYTYKFDSPGSVYYVGALEFGGYWYAVNSAGKPVK